MQVAYCMLCCDWQLSHQVPVIIDQNKYYQQIINNVASCILEIIIIIHLHDIGVVQLVAYVVWFLLFLFRVVKKKKDSINY